MLSSSSQSLTCPATTMAYHHHHHLSGGGGLVLRMRSSLRELGLWRLVRIRDITNEAIHGSPAAMERSSAEVGSTAVKDTAQKVYEKTGAFQKLPHVMPANDIFLSALRKSKRVSPSKGITNIAKRERSKGAKQIDALMKELVVPLRTYLEMFPKKQQLHPYERSLIELTLGNGRYEEVLGKVDALRKRINSVGKSYASICAQSLTKREAIDRLTEGVKKLEELLLQGGCAVDDLVGIAKTLRAMPVVDPATPTLCLVGAPNVGKSSLVHILSSGKPEICNYPFTTRGILMGHVVVDYQRFQVTDTPGLLRRSNDERNNIEKLTLAVLSHLPTGVLYVHDLSGECGSSPSDQFATYSQIREMFKEHLWLDVVSKCDLPLARSSIESNNSEEAAKYQHEGPDGAIPVSVMSGIGLEELKLKVHGLLIEQLAKIRSLELQEEEGKHGNFIS